VQHLEKLVMMANQIARNVAVQGKDKTAALTADHIARYWDPRMRTAIIDYVAGGGELEPAACAAVLLLSDPRTRERSAG
jgi:formate dehydrogenase subunit delta